MMHEVLVRHFGRLLEEKRPLPDLVMVDGGKGQLSAAIDALVEINCPPLPVIGLAKRNEEIYLPGGANRSCSTVTILPFACCRPCATKRTASPSPTTASCATSSSSSRNSTRFPASA